MGDLPGLDKFRQFTSRRELEALRPALEDGERIVHLLEASRPGGKRGLLAATDRRLLFATAGWLRRKAAAWSYADVTGLKVTKGVDDATVTATLRGGPEAVFVGCRKREAEAFAKAVRERPPGPDDPLDFTPEEQRPKTPRQLKRERLQRMLRKGTLTQKEYELRMRTLDDDE